MQDIASLLRKILEFELLQLGNSRITLSAIIIFFLVIFGFLMLSRVFARRLLAPALARTRIELGTRFNLVRCFHYILMSLGVLVAFQVVGIDLSGLVVILGFLSVGIGFGLQHVTSNFISGLILLFERPINVGDRIVVGDTEGDVLEINMRSTTVRSLNNVSIIVPNSQFISSTVTNWSHSDPKIRLELDVGVSYDSDPDRVRKALREVIDENAELLTDPAPDILFMEFGDSSWNIRIRVWIGNPKRHPMVRSDLNWAIVAKFREHEIEIPFPQRDLHVRSPLPVPVSNAPTAS